MVRWPCAGPPPAWWLRRKTSASSSATNCSGYSKRTWTNRATDNWPTTGTLDRVFPSGAARHLQLRGGHHLPLPGEALRRWVADGHIPLDSKVVIAAKCPARRIHGL